MAEQSSRLLDGPRMQLLGQMLTMSHEGRVFGPGIAFGVLTDTERQLIFDRSATIAEQAGARLTTIFEEGLPELPATAARIKTSKLILKSTVFIPALVGGGQLDDETAALLIPMTVGFGGMYGLDELVDSLDKPSEHAIEIANGGHPYIPDEEERRLTPARLSIVRAMEQAVAEATGEDAPDVIPCFTNLVLKTEARLQQLSARYANLHHTGDGARTFLAYHAEEIADLMVRDAGWQSVAATLHAFERRSNPSLPSIREIHSHPEMQELIEVGNASARVGDEESDWLEDADGVLSINPFNQYDPTLVARLCALANITEQSRLTTIDDAFYGFSTARDNATRAGYSTTVTDEFTEQMRRQFEHVESRVPANYAVYLKYGRRVCEIADVNRRMGDMKMAGGA